MKFTLLLVFGLLSGCTTLKEWFGEETIQPAQTQLSEELLYREAKARLERGDYERAIELFREFEARYPFSSKTPEVLLDLARAHSQLGQDEEAEAVLERFLRLYPVDPRLDEAHYLRGLVRFKRGMGFVERYLPIDLAKRDVTPFREALEDFEMVASRFPKSKHAEEARKRAIYLRNLLAWHEYHIADYYFKRGAFIAAVNRAVTVVRDYDQTEAVPHALDLMAKAYSKLGLDDLAARTEAIYRHNFGDRSPEKPKPLSTLLSWVFWIFQLD